jgi:nitroreductase
MKKFVLVALVCAAGLVSGAEVLKEKVLPKPDLKSGKPLMECFALRRTSRSFSSASLPDQIIGEVLFAADGVTRSNGRKTVPTARDMRNQSVYVFMADGVFLYDGKRHALVPFLKGDLRKHCGTQTFHSKAPLVLVFVSDMRAVGNTPELQSLYAGNHSGSASQNVYLYAASKDLSTVVCGLLDRDAIKKFLNLKADQMVIYSQPVAYPAK